jgi:hypothetical protein
LHIVRVSEYAKKACKFSSKERCKVYEDFHRINRDVCNIALLHNTANTAIIQSADYFKLLTQNWLTFLSLISSTDKK